MHTPNLVMAVFEFAVLLFALSLHESAHAWMASRLGDQTARMLGRITLNPAKHIDPFGTILLPLLALFTGLPLIGWAKPTPVNTRNFKNLKRDDMLTTLAGPASNVLAAIASLIILIVLVRLSGGGMALVQGLAMGGFVGQDPQVMAANPVLYPLALVFYLSVLLNLFLAAFNLLPLPPLDGSHIFRYLLPYNWLPMYDRLGIISLFLLLFFGGGIVNAIISPVLNVFFFILQRAV
jgi:Zn-dependent protease